MTQSTACEVCIVTLAVLLACLLEKTLPLHSQKCYFMHYDQYASMQLPLCNSLDLAKSDLSFLAGLTHGIKCPLHALTVILPEVLSYLFAYCFMNIVILDIKHSTFHILFCSGAKYAFSDTALLHNH